MNPDNRYSNLDTAALRSLDAICHDFENLGNAGKPQVSLESYLETAPEPLRDVLFLDLLAIEIEHQAVGGSLPPIAVFEARFPGRQSQVRSVFARLAYERSSAGSQSQQSSNGGISSQNSQNPGQTRAAHESDTIPVDAPLPKFVGRFRIEGIVGRGGFGTVYKAHDHQLDRTVAIKVPFARVVNAPPSLTEAKTVAKLDHPNIVPVYEVGTCEEYGFFIVSRFIDGTSLASRLKPKVAGEPLTVAESIATLAEALQYAHEQGLVHRDIKPANILLDKRGQPYLADFGLALAEEEFGRQPGFSGTPAYMSPEQAQGEGHRVDGRSDIFSLGTVLYQWLTGRRPFGGSTASEVMENVVASEPRPPRQFYGDLPAELEFICLKAMAKRPSQRYLTASDMAAELRAFIANTSSDQDLENQRSRNGRLVAPEVATTDGLPSSISNYESVSVIPKGLRAFDRNDQSFFLQLLPGPRDGAGLPHSVRFWKSQIEEFDGDKTFSVGLIYGPSGCGKSSMVKAGLLPQLAECVTVVYIESAGNTTEDTLLRHLRKQCSELPSNLDLRESLAALRQNDSPPGRKLLIVIDQFEQWLHTAQGKNGSVLVQALRQCDGQHLQCILMVRDEFWLAVSRLMLELDEDLVTGHNILLADLFDLDHARNILATFGQAYGRLPLDPREFSRKQADFLTQAIHGLAEDGKVVCVRLALFAEMLKGKDWLPETLKVMGGTKGVGVAFLDECFHTRFSNPDYRLHRTAARQVLTSLLPDLGSDIKGEMRTYKELLLASGYRDQPEQFEKLIRILDTELRLITPTEVEDESVETGEFPQPTSQSYQLTHDFLVPTLRQWLRGIQKESYRGRAELRLEERTKDWKSRPFNRHLPAWWEYANIRLFTPKPQWNATQRQMMRKARNFHAVRWGSGLLVALLVAFSVQSLLRSIDLRHQSEQAEIATTTLLNSSGVYVPRAIDDLTKFSREIAIQKLRERQESADPHERQKLSYALAALGGLKGPQELIDQIAFALDPDVPNLVEALRHSKSESVKALLAKFDSLGNDDFQDKSRIAILALYLGEIGPAKLMCRRAGDPIQRTWFIDQHASWHGRIFELVEIAKGVDDPDLQSALCLAVGSTELDPYFPGDREKWRPLANQWYQDSPDSGVHGAAGWMLRHWEMELPVIPATKEPTEDRNWYVTPSGMTMVKIPAGEFLNRIKGDWTPFDDDTPSQKITLSRDFLISDREVSMGQFRQAMEDPHVGLRERPYLRYQDDDDAQTEFYLTRKDKVFASLYNQNPLLTFDEEQPIQRVSWVQAVMYCNWLSRQEGLQPCYERTGKTHKFPGWNGYLNEDWQLVPETNGYRLPTNAEWELACRASTTTDYSFGNNTRFLSRYAVHEQKGPEICGSKLPNGWGLFDMHGNLSEYCNDWVRSFRVDTQSKTDPMGPGEPVYLQPDYPNSSPRGDKEPLYWRKIQCGGSYGDTVPNKASYMHSEVPLSHEGRIGIRLVRSMR